MFQVWMIRKAITRFTTEHGSFQLQGAGKVENHVFGFSPLLIEIVRKQLTLLPPGRYIMRRKPFGTAAHLKNSAKLKPGRF